MTVRATGPASVDVGTAARDGAADLQTLAGLYGPYPWSELDIVAGVARARRRRHGVAGRGFDRGPRERRGWCREPHGRPRARPPVVARARRQRLDPRPGRRRAAGAVLDVPRRRPAERRERRLRRARRPPPGWPRSGQLRRPADDGVRVVERVRGVDLRPGARLLLRAVRRRGATRRWPRCCGASSPVTPSGPSRPRSCGTRSPPRCPGRPTRSGRCGTATSGRPAAEVVRGRRAAATAALPTVAAEPELATAPIKPRGTSRCGG